MFLVQLPTLIVCLTACFVLVSKWKLGSQGSFWALLGFGLVLVLCIAMPVVQTILQSWVMQSGQVGQRVWVFSVFSIIGSVLHATAFGRHICRTHGAQSGEFIAINSTVTRN